MRSLFELIDDNYDKSDLGPGYAGRHEMIAAGVSLPLRWHRRASQAAA
jgi:hypothetical protein